MNFDYEERRARVSEAIIYALANYSFWQKVCGIEILNPDNTSPKGCLIRMITFLGNPGAFVVQIEIMRDSASKQWYVDSYFTKHKIPEKRYDDMLVTIHLVLQILCSRGRLEKKYLDLFEQENPTVFNVYDAASGYPPNLIERQLGDGVIAYEKSQEMTSCEYLLKYCLLDNAGWRYQDGYYILKEGSLTMSYRSGDHLQVQTGGVDSEYLWSMRAALGSYIGE